MKIEPVSATRSEKVVTRISGTLVGAGIALAGSTVWLDPTREGLRLFSATRFDLALSLALVGAAAALAALSFPTRSLGVRTAAKLHATLAQLPNEEAAAHSSPPASRWRRFDQATDRWLTRFGATVFYADGGFLAALALWESTPANDEAALWRWTTWIAVAFVGFALMALGRAIRPLSEVGMLRRRLQRYPPRDQLVVPSDGGSAA